VTTDDLPLPTLLSRLLIAFTTEFDNEAEHRLEHRTTLDGAGGPGRGPWLVSQAMWANFMQFVGGEGVPLHEVDDLARITNLAGLQRWGYIVAGPDAADGRPAPPRRDWIVRPTRAGRRAQEVWEPLAGIVEDRWRARFGVAAVTALRDALLAVATRSGAGLPRYLPVVRNQMFADIAHLRPRPPAGGESSADVSVLLSQVLLAFTLDFERESAVSLAVAANALRVLTGEGVRIRDLPRPYPGGWRARNPYLRQTTAVLDDPDGALPHYPMVLHRGGWPDGS